MPSPIPRHLLLLLLLTIIGCVLQPSLAAPIGGRTQQGGSKTPQTNPAPAPARVAHPPAVKAPSTSSQRASSPSPAPAHDSHTETRRSPSPSPQAGSSKTPAGQGPRPPTPGHAGQQGSAHPQPPHPTDEHLKAVDAYLAAHQGGLTAHTNPGETKITHYSMKIPVHGDKNEKMHPKVLEKYAQHAFELAHGKGGPGTVKPRAKPTVFAATHMPGSPDVYIHSNIKTPEAQADAMSKIEKHLPGLKTSMEKHQDKDMRGGNLLVDAEQGALMHSIKGNATPNGPTWENMAKEHSVGVFGHFMGRKPDVPGKGGEHPPQQEGGDKRPKPKLEPIEGHELCPMCKGSMKDLGVLTTHDYDKHVH